MRDDEYLQDGLRYCKWCKTPKEKIIMLFGVEKKVGCVCHCEWELEEKKRNRFKKEDEERERERMRSSIFDGKLKAMRFDSANASKNIDTCRKYAEKWKDMKGRNEGILMWGDVGTGKTFCAACIANELVDKGASVLVTSFPKILSGTFDKTELTRQLKTYDLVIIDDLGTERNSAYALETVYYVIDERYRAMKPLIVTTNLQLSVLKNETNMEYKRIYDRILEMCVPMNFKSESQRKEIATEKLNEMNQIFRKQN